MGYRISRQYKGGSMTLYLLEHGMLSAKGTEIPERATLFKYDDMVQIMAKKEDWTAEFVPETQGEKEFDRGTLWVTDKGDSYRLRDYGPDFNAEDPFSRTVPRYDVSYVRGGHSTLDYLPASARLVWHPKGK